MATPTTYLRVEKQANNENVGTWDQNLGVAFDLFDLAIAGTADISTTGGETTLADTQYVADDSKAAFLDISGTLASDATIVVPARDKIYGVRNATSGSYTVTIKTSTGTGVVIPQSSAAFIRVDSSDDDVDFVTAPTTGTSGVLPIAQGGTGATTASAARSALGLEIGTNVQAQSAALDDIDGLTPTDGNIIVGDGANWVAESGATARTSLGLGTGDSPTFTAVTVGATGLTVGSSVPFSDSSGTLTLQNIDALDATTEATIEAAIDTLANLTSVQGRTVTLADAGANAVFGWDDTAGAYENLTAAEATAILDAFVGDSGSGGTKGLVPAPTTGDSTKFLKGDGTWTAVPGGGDALTTNPLSQFAATTSAELAGVISDETGSGALVFANTPSLVTPDIGAATGDSLTLDTGGALRTSTTDTNTLLLQAYDVDGAAYTTFATLTAGNTPTMDLSTSVTVGSQPILVDSDIGSTVQAWDAQLDSLSSASANGVSLVTAADYAAMRALLDLEAGTDFLSPSAIAAAYQPLDADLTTWAGITPGTGVGTALAVNVGTAGAFVVNGGALGTPSSGTLTNATGLPVSSGISGLGTGVATALAVAVGSAGAPVVNGGALGTPSSGTLTNATGLPISTGVSGLGTGVATFLATPTSANLSSAVSDDDVVFVSDVREKLTANRTYYVRTDGSDSNTGLTNSAGGAFLTIQKALNVANGLDNDIYNVTIQIGNGTYNEALTVSPLLNGSKYLVIQGDTTTPSNVVINSTGTAFDCFGSGIVQIKGVKIISSVHGIKASIGVQVYYGEMEFGAITTHAIFCRGAVIYCVGNYTINGNSYTHICTDTPGSDVSTFGYTVTLSGTPAFTYFALVAAPSKLNAASTTFSGSATGTRYYAYQNAIIDTNGGGATYLPGNVAGSTATGGQYL